MPSSFQNPDPFSHPFSGLASDINFCFQTCLAGMMTVIRLECQQKEFLILKCISKSHILLVLSYPFGIIATLSIDDKMGRWRRPEVRFCCVNLLSMLRLSKRRPAFVDDEIQGGSPLSQKRKYKTTLLGFKSLFFPLVIQYKEKYILCGLAESKC